MFSAAEIPNDSWPHKSTLGLHQRTSLPQIAGVHGYCTLYWNLVVALKDVVEVFKHHDLASQIPQKAFCTVLIQSVFIYSQFKQSSFSGLWLHPLKAREFIKVSWKSKEGQWNGILGDWPASKCFGNRRLSKQMFSYSWLEPSWSWQQCSSKYCDESVLSAVHLG